MSVLLAEDNPANRIVARLTQERAGFRVHEVENGEDALQAVRRNRFDAILMDCRMPLMDGYVATRHIRQLSGSRSQVPIIALTASAFKEDRERAEQAGMDDFISKPFQVQELVSKCLVWATRGARGSGGTTLQAVVSSDRRDQNNEQQPGAYPAEFLSSLMKIFLETAPPVFQDLLDALHNGNRSEARRFAHWLQGGAARALNPALQAELRQIEEACAGDQTISNAEIESLRSSFESARKYAEAWLLDRKISRAIA
jgi:CheY-like chemotaxis protein